MTTRAGTGLTPSQRGTPTPAGRWSRLENAVQPNDERPRCVIEHVRGPRQVPLTIIGYPGDQMLVIAAYGTADEVVMGLLAAEFTGDPRQRRDAVTAMGGRADQT